MGTRSLALFSMLVLASAPTTPTEARSTQQALMGAAVYAVCPGTALKKLDTDVDILIESAPRNASNVDVLLSGIFRPEVADPDEDLFKKKFKGSFAAEFECGDGSRVRFDSTKVSSQGGSDKHHVVLRVNIDLASCPTPIVGRATFDAKGGLIDKVFRADAVPLNFTLCALVGDGDLGFVPTSFSCSIGHPLADQCP